MLEAAVDAEIDYVDKKGNSSRRLITTKEIYDYEDGEIVIRAFCHKRTGMRTFVASRIEYWLDVDSKKPVEVSDSKGFLKYLKRTANFDAVNVAGQLLSSTAAARSSSTRWASSRATSGRPELGASNTRSG